MKWAVTFLDMATIPELLSMAIQHHQSGQLPAAEPLYRQILQAEPQHPDALHLLGMIAYQVGRHEIAVQLIQQSIQSHGTAANVHNNLGGVYRALGRFPDSIASYRRALELRPDYAEAYVNLGNTLLDYGKADEAVPCYQRAIELRPDFVAAYLNLADALKILTRFDEAATCYLRILELQPQDVETRINLGNLWKDQGRLDEAIVCYRRSIELKPDLAIAYLNLGTAVKAQGKVEEAIDCYHRALALKPDFAEAHNNLGNAIKDRGQFDDAIACYRRAIELKPEFADPYVNLGNAFYDQGKLDEAIATYHQALARQPNSPKTHSNLGVALTTQGKHDEAIACYRRAIELNPNYAEAYNNLGSALKSQGKLDEAIASCRRALELNPRYADALNHLGNALKDQGKLDEAIRCYRQAIELRPDYVSVHSNLIYTMVFCPGYDNRMLREEHRRWNQQHAAPLAAFIPVHHNDRTADRRLRIGYVSSDFRNHVVGRNLLPLFREHDHQSFEIFCYSEVPNADDMTSQFQSHADTWRKTVGLTDRQMAQTILDDRIDILVDLTLHMAHHRLLVFAQKPAPVQVTFAGYPGTTGLTTIDYRLTDPYLDPPGLHDDDYSEESFRLPHSFWCYDPLDSELAVNELPAIRQGVITFGCLNNFCKVNPEVLKLWAQVLLAVDGSRLVMLSGEGSHRQETLHRLADAGITSDRVTFVPNQRRKDYLRTYHGIDIGLDTIPYNGHTTSLDSFWMGVPVVTLVGPTVVGRAGLCQLRNLGLPELIAHHPEEYVRIAAELARDPLRLSTLRATIRPRMQASPLMDQAQFARSIEAAYREMWKRWCVR